MLFPEKLKSRFLVVTRSHPFKRQRRCFYTRKRSKLRSSQGVYLVEILVAILIGSMITLTLTNLLGQTMRQSSTTENQLYANAITQELLEFTRSQSYQYLNSNIGQYTLLTDMTSAGSQGPAVRVDPTSLNLVDLAWTPQTNTNKFPGTVTYAIQSGPTNASLLVQISVQWSDSQNLKSHTISTSTIITQYGTNYRL